MRVRHMLAYASFELQSDSGDVRYIDNDIEGSTAIYLVSHKPRGFHVLRKDTSIGPRDASGFTSPTTSF